MATSAEQIHHGKLNLEAKAGPGVRLFIDLDLCDGGVCEGCEVQCSYFYHPANNGVVSLAELATYALVCRRCEEPQCITACPFEALEHDRERNNLLVRHSLRCVGCMSCSHACPYGTLYPEHVPLLVHNCDFCADRREEEPLCVRSCPHGALAVRRADQAPGENTFLVGDDLIVHSTHWMRERA